MWRENVEWYQLQRHLDRTALAHFEKTTYIKVVHILYMHTYASDSKAIFTRLYFVLMQQFYVQICDQSNFKFRVVFQLVEGADSIEYGDCPQREGEGAGDHLNAHSE